MLVSLFVAALFWNIGTWWFGLPNSSSHCLIGALIGVALGNAFVHARSLSEGVHWAQLLTVLKALALSPVLGFVLSAALYFSITRTTRDKRLYEPVGEHPPAWWMRSILILSCTGVSFAHGTNDGQKSIVLIMLSIIGLFPAVFALNRRRLVRTICRTPYAKSSHWCRNMAMIRRTMHSMRQRRCRITKGRRQDRLR
jgi:PiT family inorganic phosphate transporter